MNEVHGPNAHSRRSFLSRMGALLAAGHLAIGCSSDDDEPPPRKPEPPKQTKHVPEGMAIPDVEPTIRVRIARIRPEDPSEPTALLRVTTPGKWLEVRHPEVEDSSAMLYPPLELALEHAQEEPGWWVIDDAGFRPMLDGVNPLQVGDPESLEPIIEINGDRYAGSLRFIARTDIGPGAMDIINHVPVERYLPGVVARELYDHWHQYTHEAQAIASRSFAIAEAGYFRNRRHYDVTDTTLSQVYVGIVDHERSINAVKATRAVVLSYHDQLVSGYFSSCCGGRAARAIDAIGPNPINNVVPLHGRSDPDVCTGAPMYDWTITRPRESLGRRLASYGRSVKRDDLASIGAPQSIIPVEANEHGRPTQYGITGDGGEAILPAREIRAAMNRTVRGLPAPSDPARSSFLAAGLIDGELHVDGNGFGHGVGLCQYGAETLANRGKTPPDILAWYYPGAEFTTAYT